MKVDHRILAELQWPRLRVERDAAGKAKCSRPTESVGHKWSVVYPVAAADYQFGINCISESKPWADHIIVCVVESFAAKVIHKDQRARSVAGGCIGHVQVKPAHATRNFVITADDLPPKTHVQRQLL